jgi:phosphoglycerate dehydrogenase-like enzyme
LINAGRALLVQYEPFLEELKKGRFTAILDVNYIEPLPENYPFRFLPNVILTPHNAGWGRQGFYVEFILNEFERFFSGKSLLYEVNMERSKRMTCEQIASDYSEKMKSMMQNFQ